jgi:Cdc6-like AAA superfamily ATPase
MSSLNIVEVCNKDVCYCEVLGCSLPERLPFQFCYLALFPGTSKMTNFFDNKARALAATSSSKTKVNEPVVAAPRMSPWVEKYRPRSLEDVRSQDHVVQTLNRMVHASNLPHLLLYGPPGTGKTSTILALCRELFGPELFHSRVLELNASDERGLAVIRERVKQFASLHLVSAPASKEYRERYPCPPFKVIILDEADSLTQDAQVRPLANHMISHPSCLLTLHQRAPYDE